MDAIQEWVNFLAPPLMIQPSFSTKVRGEEMGEYQIGFKFNFARVIAFRRQVKQQMIDDLDLDLRLRGGFFPPVVEPLLSDNYTLTWMTIRL